MCPIKVDDLMIATLTTFARYFFCCYFFFTERDNTKNSILAIYRMIFLSSAFIGNENLASSL